MIRRRPALSAILTPLAGILILASGCTDQAPTEVQLRPGSAVLAAKAFRPGTYSAKIGSAGGKLEFAGIGSIDFPANALSETTKIKAKVDGRTVSVDFEPHGLVFPADAQPTLSFSIDGLNVDADRLVINYLDESGQTRETYSVAVDRSAGVASTGLRHFSQYILATN